MRLLTTALLVLLGLLLYRLWYSPGGLLEVRQLKSVKQNLVDENEQLQERNTSLAAEVMDLKHGLEAVEEKARSEMGMIKSDEVFYQIISDQNSTSDNAPFSAPLPVHSPLEKVSRKGSACLPIDEGGLKEGERVPERLVAGRSDNPLAPSYQEDFCDTLLEGEDQDGG